MRCIPFPRPVERESLIDVVNQLHKLIIKSGITPDHLVTCSEMVRDNIKKIDGIKEGDDLGV